VNKLEIIELDNGLKIYLINDNTKHTTYINLIVKYGGIHNEFSIDNKKYRMKDGMAHFIEHLVLESNIYGDIMENFGKMGIISNGITSIDKTQYYIDTVDHIYDGLKILIKGIHNPIINENIINNIKKPILEEKRRSLDNKYSVLYNKSINTVINNNKYKTVLGELKDIENISIKNINLCFNAFYRPNNEIIVIGGRFDKNKIINVIQDTYNNIKFDNKKVLKTKEEYKEKVNIKKSVLKTNTGIKRTLITFKLNTINYNAIEKLNLDLYIHCFLRMNFGIISKLSKDLIDKEIVSGGICFSNNILENYHIIRIEADTEKSALFINNILDYLNKKDYIYDNELFDLYKKNYIIDLITRNDNIYNMIDPFIENIISFNYEKLDSIEDIEILNFKEFIKYIESLDFSNYSLIELKPY